MKEAIINQKIRAELSNLPIDTEARIVYLLVEIRKVFEHDCVKNSLLGFYGDWVVHTRMDRAFAKKIFNEINDSKSEIGHHIKSFNLLKGQLRRFFEANHLPTELVDKHWITFRDGLLNVLIDTPILNDAGDKSFGFYKNDELGGVQYYIKHGVNFHTLGRVWV
jgi:hypothetical protein